MRHLFTESEELMTLRGVSKWLLQIELEKCRNHFILHSDTNGTQQQIAHRYGTKTVTA